MSQSKFNCLIKDEKGNEKEVVVYYTLLPGDLTKTNCDFCGKQIPFVKPDLVVDEVLMDYVNYKPGSLIYDRAFRKLKKSLKSEKKSCFSPSCIEKEIRESLVKIEMIPLP